MGHNFSLSDKMHQLVQSQKLQYDEEFKQTGNLQGIPNRCEHSATCESQCKSISETKQLAGSR